MSLEERFQQLSQHRRSHIERVVAVMEMLAQAHDLNIEDARLAGFGHDLAREMARPDLLSEARTLGLSWGWQEEAEPLLLHGPVAAAWLQRCGRGNPSVWNAIRYHTTAAPGLDALGQALFVADGVEPGRQYAEREALLRLALDDLGRGYRAVLQQTCAYLERRGLSPHTAMLAALGEEMAPEQ